MSDDGEVKDVLESLSTELKVTVNGMFEALGAFNTRLERIEKWIKNQEKPLIKG